MANKTVPDKAAKKPGDRDARLKAALKANMARRKAQARARSAAQDAGETNNRAKGPHEESS